jgi:hypothetical protein
MYLISLLSFRVNTVCECYSFFEALDTVYCNIYDKDNLILSEEWILLLL